MTLKPTPVSEKALPGVTEAGKVPKLTVPGIVKCVCVRVQDNA